MAPYYDTNFRLMEKRMKADERGEPGRESRSFDSMTTTLTSTLGWFITMFLCFLKVHYISLNHFEKVYT